MPCTMEQGLVIGAGVGFDAPMQPPVVRSTATRSRAAWVSGSAAVPFNPALGGQFVEP